MSYSSRPRGTDLQAATQQGRASFAKWFIRIMDTNGWSHPGLVKLAKHVTGGKSFLHSSQIAGLRAADLKNPGPRSFVALEYLWRAIDDYQKGKSTGITFGNLAPLVEKAKIMRDPEGNPASLGYMVEVYSGLAPVPIDLSVIDFNEKQAKMISDNAGRLIRRMMVLKGWDVVDEIHRVTTSFSRDPALQNELLNIIKGQNAWAPEVLNERLASLRELFSRIFDWNGTVANLIDELQKKY
jgi:hypothetical protein